MLRLYLRLALLIAGLIGAVFLFAFAFTAGAIVVLLALGVVGILMLFGLTPRVQWHVVRSAERQPQDSPLVIDHDPNDLPPR